jgi:predicted transcriptional regulator
MLSLRIAVLVFDNPGFTIIEVAKKLNISYSTAHRYLRNLREQEKLYARIGTDNAHSYHPNPEERPFFDSARALLDNIEKYRGFWRMK